MCRLTDKTIKWLMEGDPSVQYLTTKYLFNTTEKKLNILRSKIKSEGFGKDFLDKQKTNDHWDGILC